MGFLDKLFGGNKGFVLGAPVEGKCVPITEVPDPTFGEGMMGEGVAIYPTGGQIFAPCDGTIDMMFNTGHAVSMTTEIGADVLIHVGLETVNLKGKYFTIHVNNGDQVKKGDLMITFDREAIAAEGYNMITPMVVCNSSSFGKVTTKTGNDVAVGDELVTIVE